MNLVVVPATARRATSWLAREAVRALYRELVLEPKPGLVSLRDNGSHDDMDAALFMRSLFALRHYFAQAAEAGAHGHPFDTLRQHGQAAERRMLRATGGVNTHRGAVFLLGLLCAAGGGLQAEGRPLAPEALRGWLMRHHGAALAAHAAALRAAPARSHGQQAARSLGLRSASEEAALGWPTLFEVTLPTLRSAEAAGAPARAARVQALFATIARLDDTNLVHRGGAEGLWFARAAAARFLDRGGVFRGDWLPHARAVHQAFVVRRLSPGGAADLLGAACWVDAVTRG
ncbi:triphosphoribosyl-dephospho-CoA synthase MdcB [Aquabacterium sp. J223]|uniref:triphosphoribosyl-dephospho-CoA synthase MdcB n=1 Tax=Aquabacterium sp. J223 TaxID=2898431 RepID=UPI0021ADC030|nr:triphosphoribosyl-dephospho-CoA synthase MdcB [Aquabacterium sp. J223]UUX96946.1 triphosphoribosyl-dephospho-CoA synthase MdcB [Aquabacterium sp. J223]